MPMDLKKLRPKSDQRAMVVGATGTGKTTLARYLLQPYPKVIVIDPKCTYGGREGEPGYQMVSTPRALRGLRASVDLIQYRPDELHQSVSDYDEVYKWCY